MCDSCNQLPFAIDMEEELAIVEERLYRLKDMRSVQHEMEERDFEFADSLYSQYLNTSSLSPKQWSWVDKLTARYKEAEPLYGDFNAILVMFRIATSNERGRGLKKPKIRLMSKDDRYVQLNFDPENTSEIKVYVDGWQGHGRRKFAGWIRDGKLIPYDKERMTEDVRLILQEFALDPAKVAKAMALKLGACMYCGSRLTDDRSKEVGYGPTCAENYGLVWGGHDHGKVMDLKELFA